MPVFAYQALTRTGTERAGQLQAENLNSAAQALRTEGLRVLKIAEKRRSGFLGQDNFKDWYATQRSVSNDTLIFFYRQMAFMLKAGLAVAECLELASTQIDSPRLNFAVRKMYRDIQAGKSLSDALRKHKDVFSDRSFFSCPSNRMVIRSPNRIGAVATRMLNSRSTGGAR